MTAATPRVLVTCPPMLGMIDAFRDCFARAGVELDAPEVVQTLSEEALIARLPGVDGWIIGDDPATARVLEAGAAGRLKAAVKWGVGTDNVDFAAARRLGLDCTNTPGVFGREVADIAMHYVTALARHTVAIDRAIRQHAAWPKPRGLSLAGRTVALVGFGDIGRQTARRLLAAEMRVLAYDPAFEAQPGLDVTPARWPERLDEADFLVFTCPLTETTHHLFDRALIERLKPGVRVVNVGRGPVIATDALVAALERGVVHSAALDVFEHEPLAADAPLRRFDACIFGSHNASNTADAVDRVSHQAIDTLFGYLGLDG
ncbi:phosphoglycerate dehydrogenase [Rhodothalassium salexigens]|uniref:phosphoglycerate dehydrogenase n=1 Tax=Rhodothalassium salexigens TaxID=1086 RepID=UPI001911BA19|nr:phosphoglycerate dehydrogenase [Rhodothalassium salexigens]